MTAKQSIMVWNDDTGDIEIIEGHEVKTQDKRTETQLDLDTLQRDRDGLAALEYTDYWQRVHNRIEVKPKK